MPDESVLSILCYSSYYHLYRTQEILPGRRFLENASWIALAVATARVVVGVVCVVARTKSGVTKASSQICILLLAVNWDNK